MLGFNFNHAVKYIFLCFKNSISHTLPYLKTKEKKRKFKPKIKFKKQIHVHIILKVGQKVIKLLINHSCN